MREEGQPIEFGLAQLAPAEHGQHAQQIFADQQRISGKRAEAMLLDPCLVRHAVVVGDIEERENGALFIPASVYVERQSQKGMVIGKGGELIKTVGAETRQELESLFGVPVFLDLRVKVEKDWQRRESTLDRMGF